MIYYLKLGAWIKLCFPNPSIFHSALGFFSPEHGIRRAGKEPHMSLLAWATESLMMAYTNLRHSTVHRCRLCSIPFYLPLIDTCTLWSQVSDLGGNEQLIWEGSKHKEWVKQRNFLKGGATKARWSAEGKGSCASVHEKWRGRVGRHF